MSRLESVAALNSAIANQIDVHRERQFNQHEKHDSRDEVLS
jgi:hypothetical protein